MEDADFGGEGRGTGRGFSVSAGAGVVVGGGRGGWTNGGKLCCINKFMLKSTESLKRGWLQSILY